MPTLKFSLTRVKSLLGGDAFNWIRQVFPQIIRDGSGLPIGLQDNDGNVIAAGGGISAANNNTFTKAQRGSLPTIAYAAAITLDFSASNSFNIGVLTGNLTLANPINMPALGETQSGSIFFTQDATGNRTLSLGSNFKTATGSPTTLSTAPNAKDRFDYIVDASGVINYSLAKGVSL